MSEMQRGYALAGFLVLEIAALNVSLGVADTTIDSHDKFSWIANADWLNWEGDAANGAEFTEHYASGFIHGANIGWINLGDGSPENGTTYSNLTPEDFGVNVDPIGDPDSYLLSGYAWSANTGWIVLDVAAAGAENRARIEKATGILRGFAWSPNLGWLALDAEGVAVVRTEVRAGRNAVSNWALYP